MSFTRSSFSAWVMPPNAESFVFATGPEFTSLDPATGSAVATLLESTGLDCDNAIALSRTAARNTQWSTTPSLRADVLYAWSEALQFHQSDLAELLTREQGKPLRESQIEIAAAADQFRYYAGLTRAHSGRVVTPGPAIECVALNEPMGVVGIITPWNWPLVLLAKSLAPALAAGNSCVIKPAEDTPAIVLQALSVMLNTASVPAGVITCIIGDGPTIGSKLVGNPDIDMLAFTGSAVTGREIAAEAGRALQPVTLELGGKSPTLVFDDAELDKVIDGIVAGSMTTSGQMCTAATRVIVQLGVAPKVRTLLQNALAKMKVGNGLEDSTRVGPLISARQHQHVNAFVSEGRKHGTVLFEGEVPSAAHRAGGFFVAPILLGDLPRESPLHREEIFGPVITLQTFADEDEMVAEANAVEYGLAASVWTSDVRRAWRVARSLDAGAVWVNTHNQFYAEIETGARKQSGFGDSQGVAGLSRFTQTKLVNFDGRPTMW